jgi:hypothetical protein
MKQVKVLKLFSCHSHICINNSIYFNDSRSVFCSVNFDGWGPGQSTAAQCRRLGMSCEFCLEPLTYKNNFLQGHKVTVHITMLQVPEAICARAAGES